MANAPKKELPENWNLPALEGSTLGVTSEIANLTAPEHFKAALLDDIKAVLDGTDHNWLKIHAHGTRQQGEKSIRHIVLLDIETSKKNL